MSETTTQEYITRRPQYIEEREQLLLDQIFGTPTTDADGNITFGGGLIDAEAYPDLFTIPEYEQAGRDPLETAVTGMLDTTVKQQGFLDRAQPYFLDATGTPRYLPDAASSLKTGADTLGDAELYFPTAKTAIAGGTGAIGAKGVYDAELKKATDQVGKGTDLYDAQGRAKTLFSDANTSIKGGLGSYVTDPNAYKTALASIKSNTGQYGTPTGAYDKALGMLESGRGTYGVDNTGFGTAQDLISGGQGQFGAKSAFDESTGTAFELASQGLGKFDPNSAVQDFMNPYQQQVIDNAMEQINRQGNIALQGQAAKAVGAGAFGGSRAGVQAAETQRAIAQEKNKTISDLLSSGYTQALSGAMTADEASRKRALEASGITGQLGSTGTQIEAKAYEDARARGLTGAGLEAEVARVMNTLGMTAYEQGATRDISAGQVTGTINQAEQTARQKAYEDGASRGLTGAQLESYIAEAGEKAKQTAYESGMGRQMTAGQLQSGIGQAVLGQEATSFEGSEDRVLKAADLYRSMGLSSAEAQTKALSDEKTRSLEAGRLYGGLGQALGTIGSSQADVGSQYGNLAATGADIGRVYSALTPADMSFMYNLGGAERTYDQQGIDIGRQEDMRGTEQALMPYSYAYGALSGTPSANVSNQYNTNPSYTVNPFIAGIGAYSTLQGVNQQRTG